MNEAMEHYKRAMQLFGQNKHLEAMEEYRKALAEKPDWTDALHGLAMAQMHQGLLDEALATGQRIVELDPEDPFAHTSLSMFYQRKGLIPEAEKEAAKARMVAWKQDLKTNPNAPPPSGAGDMKVMQ